MNAQVIDRLMEQLSELFGQSDAANPAEVRSLLSATVTAALARMNLVTREEFDAQSALLTRTRQKLEILEAQLNALEAGPSQND